MRVLAGSHGAGVQELIEFILKSYEQYPARINHLRPLAISAASIAFSTDILILVRINSYFQRNGLCFEELCSGFESLYSADQESHDQLCGESRSRRAH